VTSHLRARVGGAGAAWWRWLVAIIGVGVGIVSFAPPAAAAAAPRKVTVTGTLSVLIGERPSGQLVKYLLQQGHHYYVLKLDASERRAVHPNATIMVQGAQQGSTIEVTGVKALAEPRATPLAGVRSVLVMRVFWNAQDDVTPAIADNQIEP
jgi:hypothetical protein